jgi:HPt (histidine-containing phosphotransfer) domain-containing protein
MTTESATDSRSTPDSAGDLASPRKAPVDLRQLELIWHIGTGCYDFFGETVEIFVAEATARVQEVQEALDANLPQEAGERAHGLRGSAGIFGAHRLVHLAAEIERLGTAGALAGARAVFADLPGELAAVAAALRAATSA